MFELGRHAGFIIASYGIALAVVIALIVWIRVDYGIQRRLLAELEARGMRRRSDHRDEKHS
ncbi:MAG: heme exporter protein CcmD [Hyphomicrobiales bacterium]|nr:MAG: heme exporter protein CcmD [Hyphomicrobiales bacterium]